MPLRAFAASARGTIESVDKRDVFTLTLTSIKNTEFSCSLDELYMVWLKLKCK